MYKYALYVEYDGTDFYGWQSQPGRRTIQEELERSVSIVADHKVEVYGSGRTDRGVHATGQVAHFETSSVRDERSWLLGINTQLPEDIRITLVKSVPYDFHARFSAKWRHYRYKIYNHQIRPSLNRNYITWEKHPLDVELMHKAAQNWIGEHDFSSFRGADCQSHTPIRALKDIRVTRDCDMIYVDVCANAFLHHMVRNLVGTLITVGSGKKPPAWAKEVLEAKDRTKAGMMAEARGLYLVKIEY